MNTVKMKARVEAEHRARLLFIALVEICGDNKEALIEGMNVAMVTVRNDLVALLPQKKPEEAPQTQEPAVGDTPVPSPAAQE